ncbi:hypothetical protein AJ87_22490 [Rhizobium yanglingense]|nr:hypothetical protein AJ87_22490 [Rhizobium yanglingense]
MADFIAVIRRAVDGLAENTPEMRAKVYERARGAVQRQLENMKPRPPEAMLQRQLDKLDAAIREWRPSTPRHCRTMRQPLLQQKHLSMKSLFPSRQHSMLPRRSRLKNRLLKRRLLKNRSLTNRLPQNRLLTNRLPQNRWQKSISPMRMNQRNTVTKSRSLNRRKRRPPTRSLTRTRR